MSPQASSSTARGIRITGWGTALPEGVLSNAELEASLDTTDIWITERTGIKERRVGSSASELGIIAGRGAIEVAGIDPGDIDEVLVATTSPDQQMPSTASTVQDALDIAGGAVDINAACSGFVYGLVHAAGLVAVGAERILLVGSEHLSRITDRTDRNTAILFGDGAGAVVIESVDGPGTLLGWDLGSNGASRHILYADHGGHMTMDGKEVFRQAVRVMVSSGKKALERAGVDAEDIALVVPHQANIRIIEAAANRLGIPMDRTATVLESTGNTSSASIPLALVDAIDQGRLAAGDLVLFLGFGAGMSWASAIVRWDPGHDRATTSNALGANDPTTDSSKQNARPSGGERSKR